MPESNFIRWSEEEYSRFGLETQISAHRYHELPLFTRESLVALLDDYPRKWLQAFHMGTDPCRPGDWKCVDIDATTTGAQMWQAVEQGRVWLNITHIEEYNDEFRALITDMYRHLGVHCPHLQNPRAEYSTLLISSPGAQVYYHVDAEPNMLWHIRGKKLIYVYPDMDTRFVSQQDLEDIYAGEIDENLTYRSEFDQHALKHLLVPGEVASWRHNAPHRIVNDDLNVSLATSYYTPAIYQRQYVQLANRHVLRRLGMQNRSMRETGLTPSMKRFTYRALNRVHSFRNDKRSSSYITDLQLDPEAPLGVRKLGEPRAASFSVLREAS